MARARVNKPNMIFLTSSEQGPVGLDIKFFAEDVVENARDNVREVLRNYTGDIESVLGAIGYEIVQGPTGIEAFIGIRDTGAITNYLAEKEDKEGVWLAAALAEAKAEYQASIPAFTGAHVARGVGGLFIPLER